MSGKPIRVQLAEDHEVVRTGFRYLLDHESDIEVVAESASGAEACRDYDRCRPDILIMDISMPDMNGLDAIRRIQTRHPDARILVLSMHTGLVAERALEQGACGYVSKQCAARELVIAIRRIMQGGRYLDSELAAELLARKRKTGKATISSLSKRELEVCMLLVEGLSVSGIAKRLHLSEKTIYTHREHILHKLLVENVVELTQLISHLGVHPSI